MVMFVVDGTGEYNAIKNFWIGRGYTSNADYDSDMKMSFCNQIAQQLGEPRCHYYRGPDVLGQATIINAVKIAVQAHGSSTSVFLAGYSRGAAAVIEAAHSMKKIGVKVQAMFLFDPVKRDYSLPNCDTIPSNVEVFYKITRTRLNADLNPKDLFLGELRAYANDIWTTEVSVLTPSPLTGETWGDQQGRKWMLNCGNKVESSKTRHSISDPIDGSHGAMGGVGYGAVPIDMGAQAKVVEFMNAAFKNEKLDVTLKSYWKAWQKTDILDGRRQSQENLESARKQWSQQRDWNRQTDLGNHT